MSNEEWPEVQVHTRSTGRTRTGTGKLGNVTAAAQTIARVYRIHWLGSQTAAMGSSARGGSCESGLRLQLDLIQILIVFNSL